MASSKEYLSFVLDQLSDLEGIACKPMMGEYVIYYGGKVIGSLGVERYNEKQHPELDALLGRELGYVLNRDYWGQGLMPEALGEVMRFFFEEVGFDRVEACHHPDNPNSGRVMQKCGMTYKGTWFQEDKGRELCWYSIEKETYLKNKERM